MLQAEDLDGDALRPRLKSAVTPVGDIHTRGAAALEELNDPVASREGCP
jgi:hypothetical protein